jgi:hypothetical protein
MCKMNVWNFVELELTESGRKGKIRICKRWAPIVKFKRKVVDFMLVNLLLISWSRKLVQVFHTIRSEVHYELTWSENFNDCFYFI